MILLKIIINFANLASQTTTRNKLAPPLHVNYFSIPRFVLRSTHLLSFFSSPNSWSSDFESVKKVIRGIRRREKGGREEGKYFSRTFRGCSTVIEPEPWIVSRSWDARCSSRFLTISYFSRTLLWFEEFLYPPTPLSNKRSISFWAIKHPLVYIITCIITGILNLKPWNS